MPTWVQLVFLACGVCFILALKGLSGPRTARNGNLLGAGAAIHELNAVRRRAISEYQKKVSNPATRATET